VPREVCETPTLAQKLTGFALKPLTRLKASQQRRECLREEIERLRNGIAVEASRGLWGGKGFEFVAETKAKTMQLRNRTIALLQKEASFEKLPEDELLNKEACSEQLIENSAAFEKEEGAQNDRFMMDQVSAKEQPEEQTPDEVIQDDLANKAKSSQIRANMRLKFKEGPTSTQDATKSGLLQLLQEATKVPISGEVIAGTQFLPMSSRRRMEEVGEARHQRNIRPAPIERKKGQPAVNRRRASPTAGEGQSSNQLGGSLSRYIEKQVLFEDKREIVVQARGGTGTQDLVPATIRVLENRTTGGIRLEVCRGFGQWVQSLALEMSLGLDEVTNLMTRGNKLQEAVEARYKWLCDSVRLKPIDALSPREKEGNRRCNALGDKEGKGYILILAAYDSRHEEDENLSGLDMVRTAFRDAFAKSKTELAKQDSEFNLRTAFKNPDMESLRKDREISSARKKFDLYENTSKALHDWYDRLDSSGDGSLDEKEFAHFLRGVVHTFGQTLDDNQVRRHWQDLRASDGIGFTKFVNYLLHKFPHVKNMTAFQVKKFEEGSKLYMQARRERRKSVAAIQSFMHELHLDEDADENEANQEENEVHVHSARTMAEEECLNIGPEESDVTSSESDEEP